MQGTSWYQKVLEAPYIKFILYLYGLNAPNPSM